MNSDVAFSLQGPKKEQLSGVEFAGKSSQNLAHLLCEMREVNKSLQFEADDLKQKLADAQGDIKVSNIIHVNFSD